MYAKLIFTDTAELLIPMFGSDFLTGDRKKYIEEYTVTNRMTSSSPPAFLVNSVDDSVVSEKNPLAYASKCHELKIPFEMHSFLEGGPWIRQRKGQGIQQMGAAGRLQWN